MIDDMLMGTVAQFESGDEEEHYVYETSIEDHLEVEGISVDPRSMLRMRIESAEVPWSNLRFEFKTQSHQSYNTWLKKILPSRGFRTGFSKWERRRH